MSKTVVLLKPFVFSPPAGKSRIAQEVRFTPNKDANGNWVPTDTDLPDEVAGHEWIKDHYADGAIERPEATAKRAEAVAARLKQQQDDNAIQIARAEQAMTRAGLARKPVDTNDANVQKDLNTPVNELKGNRGADVDDKDDDKSSTEENADKKTPKAKSAK